VETQLQAAAAGFGDRLYIDIKYPRETTTTTTTTPLQIVIIIIIIIITF
jgi:hypothetical protein